jgi:hypothetical protein
MEPQTNSTQTNSISNTGFFQTNLATAVLLAASILPSTVHHIPSEVHMPNIEQTRFGGAEYPFTSEVNQEEQYMQVLENFATELLNNIVDTEPDIAQITNDYFFEMYENF